MKKLIIFLITIIIIGLWQIVMIGIGQGNEAMRNRGHEIWELVTHSDMLKKELNNNGIFVYSIYLRSTCFTHHITIKTNVLLNPSEKKSLCRKLTIVLYDDILEKDDKVVLCITP